MDRIHFMIDFRIVAQAVGLVTENERSMKMSSEVVLFVEDGAVAYLTLNREAVLNALNSEMMSRIEEIFNSLETDENIGVVVITGAGSRSFAAGADIKELKEEKRRTAFIARGQQILSGIRASDKVVIAAVNGYAVGGGCELALACDIRIASENAKFGLPEAVLGLIPGYGGTQLLPRLIGPGRAKYMMFSGAMLSAAEAYAWGLVEKVCTADTLMEEAGKLARRICAMGPLAIRGCKRAVGGGMERSLEEALRFELEISDELANSEDAEEGMAAFLEKRKPAFRGK